MRLANALCHLRESPWGSVSVTGPRGFRIEQLSRIALNVLDLERSACFYREALGFVDKGPAEDLGPGPYTTLSGSFRRLLLDLGAQHLELTQWQHPGRPYPPASRANDLWFQHFAIVSCDISRAYLRLMGSGATPITVTGPQTLPAASGGATAYKFRDPDGHPLELLQFPGPPAAPGSDSALNTGIDHTALSVSQSDKSIAFYHDLLGLSHISTHENTGAAQDSLDDLSHTVTQVTALAPSRKTPHLELLGYRRPRGRPLLAPANVNDVAASRIVFRVDKLPNLLTALAAHPVHNPAATAELLSVSDRTALVRDPDGHILLFEQT